MDVVFRLALGQAQGVDLHAVAEAGHGRILDLVTLAADMAPEFGKGAHLADFLHEADAGIQKERDSLEDLRQFVRRDLSRVAYGVHHGLRRAQGVGQFLFGRGSGLLEVVAAHVDRVPLRQVLHGEGDGVHGEFHGRLGRKDVGSAREILFHDVVLRRAVQKSGIDAPPFRQGHVQRKKPGGPWR